MINHAAEGEPRSMIGKKTAYLRLEALNLVARITETLFDCEAGLGGRTEPQWR